MIPFRQARARLLTILFLVGAAGPVGAQAPRAEGAEGGEGRGPRGQTGGSGESAEELPVPLGRLADAFDPGRYHRRLDQFLGRDTDHSDRPRGPELPLAMFGDSIRPLGSLKHEILHAARSETESSS
ncbi:MAG TPA: hypothetical protein VGE74_16905 [Gemmata sp.]